MKLRSAAARAVAITAAVMVLLSGCGGDDDSGSDAGPGDDGTAAKTTSAGAPARFDPPKGFVPTAAIGIDRNLKDNQDTVSAGMVGQTALSAGLTGLIGRSMAADGKTWTVPATTAGLTTSAVSTPMSVQVAGRDVVAIAYVQSGKGKGQVLFQWLDPADGTKVAEVIADLTTVLGRGQRGNRLQRQTYDATTGQIAIGVTPGSDAAEARAGDFTVYADPTTRKSAVIPFVVPGGVRNGVVAGVRSDRTLVMADGATARITKSIPHRFESVWPVGSGLRHAVFMGIEIVESPSRQYSATLLSVDLASGSIVSIKSSMPGLSGFSCLGDRAGTIACNGSQDLRKTEILGIDDTTGRKVWGFTEKQGAVPRVTAAFHGVAYAQNGAKPVLLDIATGKYLPTGAPTTPPSSTSLSLYDNAVQSPTAVTPYGGVYLQPATGTDSFDFQAVLIALKPTA